VIELFAWRALETFAGLVGAVLAVLMLGEAWNAWMRLRRRLRLARAIREWHAEQESSP
jgi:hypothetical protein